MHIVSRPKLDHYRGLLIANLSRDITWSEFADMADISPHTIKNIRNGHTGGSPRTLERIVAMLRSNGVNAKMVDLLQPA